MMFAVLPHPSCKLRAMDEVFVGNRARGSADDEEVDECDDFQKGHARVDASEIREQILEFVMM